MAKKKTGRANGKKTRCPNCDSTTRLPYEGTTTREISGKDEDGKPYTHVVWRRTRCKKCNQARIDRTFENRK